MNKPRYRPLMLLLPLALTGCAELSYYYQATSGQLDIWQRRRPIETLIESPELAPTLRQQLQYADAIHRFATTTLHLPGKGYRHYADLQRPYVVKNVFAAPPFSLEPKQWCFPVAGCVSYRGYFSADQAERLGEELRGEGYEVFIADIPAYSTLGWFADPLLNTYIYWTPGLLAELIIHELSHQRLYIANDVDFNESFATFVGQLGAERWLMALADPKPLAEYRQLRRFRQQFQGLILATKEALDALYGQTELPLAEMRRRKEAIYQELVERYQTLKREEWGGYSGYDRWFDDQLNNAKLAAFVTYNRYVDAFAALFHATEGDFKRFYRRVEAIAQLDAPARQQALSALLDAEQRAAR